MISALGVDYSLAIVYVVSYYMTTISHVLMIFAMGGGGGGRKPGERTATDERRAVRLSALFPGILY